jgi:hypothetical protein
MKVDRTSQHMKWSSRSGEGEVGTGKEAQSRRDSASEVGIVARCW